MAFAPVNPQAKLWQAAGLNKILVPEDFLLERKAPLVQKPENRLPKRTGSHVCQAPAQARPVAAISPQTQKNGAWQPMPVENWPASWRERLGATRKASFVWTYQELGQDLTSAGGPTQENPQAAEKRFARGNFLRSIFRQLAFPPGSHSFWPVTMPETAAAANSLEHDLFWSGIMELGCGCLIIFGSAAAKIALPDKAVKPLSTFRESGVLALVLWDINGLVERPQKHAELLEYLRRFLMPISGGAGVVKGR